MSTCRPPTIAPSSSMAWGTPSDPASGVGAASADADRTGCVSLMPAMAPESLMAKGEGLAPRSSTYWPPTWSRVPSHVRA
jgi:hypothetical protein